MLNLYYHPIYTKGSIRQFAFRVSDISFSRRLKENSAFIFNARLSLRASRVAAHNERYVDLFIEGKLELLPYAASACVLGRPPS